MVEASLAACVRACVLCAREEVLVLVRVADLAALRKFELNSCQTLAGMVGRKWNELYNRVENWNGG